MYISIRACGISISYPICYTSPSITSWYTVESACFYIHWLTSSGILDRWAGDCHLGFWKGDDPDARIKDPARYEKLCTHRSTSLRNFLASGIIGDPF